MTESPLIDHEEAEAESRAQVRRFSEGLDKAYVDSLIMALRRGHAGRMSEADVDSEGLNIPQRVLGHYQESLSFIFKSYGVRIGLYLSSRELFLPIIERLPLGWTTASSSSAEAYFRIVRSEESNDEYKFTIAVTETGRSDTGVGILEDIVESFERSLEAFLAEHARPCLFLHAGVVAWNGRGLLLPGRSFSGKSTLVAALVAAGATYYSDEYAVLDRQGRVYPFPRRISLRRGNDDGTWQHERVAVPRDFTAPAKAKPVPVGLVAVLSYDPDHAWENKRLDQAAAIMALCSQTVAIRRRPEDAFAILGNVVRLASVIYGYRGEAQDAAAWLMNNNWLEWRD